MRAFLILCVSLFTLLTFYSALWFKSEEIQTDITTRVTDDLNTSGAKDVAVDVDGRHVTLSGVVYDEATETAYLDTANDTYGALGPIDGLTYLSGGGFVKAVKSDTGIVLSGTVPSQEARDNLVAAAGESTDGDVTDNLTIGGSDGDWQLEADYGVAKLADLSNGALAVSPGSYTLSGLATGDADAISADLTEREGWQSFVTSPAIEAGLSDEVARLKEDNSTLDKSVGDLTSQRDALTASLAAVNLDYKSVADARDAAMGERDTAQDDLAKLRASLDDNQTNAASLAADLEAANAGVAERDVTIEGLNGQITGLTDQNGTLTAELEAQKSALSADQQEVVSLQNKIEVQSATIAGLTSDLDAKAGDLAALQSTTSNLGSEGDAAKAKIADLTSELAQRDEQEARLDGQVTDLTGKLADTQAQVTTLEGQLAEQSAGDPEADARLAALTANLGAQTAKVDDLTAVVAERDATIVSLQNAAPVTAASAPETAQQCAARASQILEVTQINFSSGTANITRGSLPTLERLTGIAIACSDSGLSMEIGGHTDSQGSDANNQTLSERRANAIASFMTERGVPADTLKAVGYGEAKPIGDNATPAGRAKNRRISFEWQAR